MADAKTITMVASQGTLDGAYPPMILGSTSAALDIDVNIFFTFYGLKLLLKDPKLMVTPAGNPAMPLKMPFGSDSFRPSW